MLSEAEARRLLAISVEELKGTDPAGWELLPHGTVEYLISPSTVLSHSVDHLALYRFVPLAATMRNGAFEAAPAMMRMGAPRMIARSV